MAPEGRTGLQGNGSLERGAYIRRLSEAIIGVLANVHKNE